MKKITILLAMLFLSVSFVMSQTVDSIKVEQSGDFIKIRYKILNSTPNQLFRVRVLCSINGGLNTEIRSISGDTGDNVVGGKTEYFVVWDVLKDVEELKSAEFIVRAELVKDLNAIISQGKNDDELTKYWSKERFYIALAADFPGPKAGIMLGYMGSFGIVTQLLVGKIPVQDEPLSLMTPETHLGPRLGICLTKRIINSKSLQMHLMAGMALGQLEFKSSSNQFTEEVSFGPAAGLILGSKRVVCSLSIVHLDPGNVEKRPDDLMAVSPLSYISTGIGLRF